MAFSDLILVSKKHNLILVLLDFSFHQCVRIWLYLATDFWEEDKHAPDGMKKKSQLSYCCIFFTLSWIA